MIATHSEPLTRWERLSIMPRAKRGHRDCLDELRDIELKLTASLPEIAVIINDIPKPIEKMTAGIAACRKFREENEAEALQYTEAETIWRLAEMVFGIDLAQHLFSYQEVHRMWLESDEQLVKLRIKYANLEQKIPVIVPNAPKDDYVCLIRDITAPRSACESHTTLPRKKKVKNPNTGEISKQDPH